MPPKIKKNGVKGKSDKPSISDGDQILLEKRKKLIGEATRLQESIEEENAISRDFCTQTDKLRSFKEILDRELEAKRRMLWEKQNNLLALKDSHSLNISALKYKVKESLMLQQNDSTAEKVKSESFVNELKDVNHSNLIDMEQEKVRLEALNKEYELSQIELVKNMKRRQSQMITGLRKDYENQSASLSKHAQQNERMARNIFDEKLSQKADEFEEEKVQTIQALLDRNEKSLEDVRRCFHKTIEDEMDTLKDLKMDLIGLKREESKTTKKLTKATTGYNSLKDPLHKAKKLVECLSKNVDLDATVRRNLDLAQKKLYVVEEKLEVIKWHHEVLFQQYSKLGEEVDRAKLKERHL
eukprot:CAMPEP_0196812632 /NCGR_PEP_ID=MMETSP1362-20130617/29190_1 /TAXON_ID=163516 /ORGANISM="Leptocylindrus danicus, Strain CCMP1856" /LENGTH=354 /DNA_ID=CAMNT_0042188421 /DNA_START=182 /DNA_END=1243 /DNA_ORIENTATION=+